jgi:hypothetical protein
VASLDSQLHISNARLNETHAEVRSLMSKQSLLQNRIQELEQLLEVTRAQQFSQSSMITGPESNAHMRTLQVSCTTVPVLYCCYLFMPVGNVVRRPFAKSRHMRLLMCRRKQDCLSARQLI